MWDFSKIIKYLVNHGGVGLYYEKFFSQIHFFQELADESVLLLLEEEVWLESSSCSCFRRSALDFALVD